MSAPQEQAGPSQTKRNDKKRAKSPADVKPAKRPKVEPSASKVDFGVIEISDDDEDFDAHQVGFALLCFYLMEHRALTNVICRLDAESNGRRGNKMEAG